MSTKKTVAVIGAGPAGITAALALKELGYHDVVILEAADDVGGKCKTMTFDGVSLEVGANLTTPRYERIRALAARVGVHPRDLPERNVTAVAASTVRTPNVFERLVVRALQWYYGVLWRRSGVAEPGYVAKNPNLYLPFDRWLKRNWLGPLGKIFSVLFVAYGYGKLMSLPAIYALKFFDPIHLAAAIDVVFEKDVADTTEFAEGFQQLWRNIVSTYGLRVVTGVQVTGIQRNRNGAVIRYLPKGSTNVTKMLFVEKLVVACSPTAIAPVMDLTPEERDLFDQIHTQRYYVLVSRIEGLGREAEYIDPYAFNLTRYYPTVVYPPAANDAGIYVSYAYGIEGEDTDEGISLARIALDETVVKLGGSPPEHLYAKTWDYFPHVAAEGAQDFYVRLNALQGQNHTLYVGETFAFTLTELIAEYSDTTIRAHFGPKVLLYPGC